MDNKYGIEVTRQLIHGLDTMVATIPGTTLGFHWYGGPYIDGVRYTEEGSSNFDYTEECINIWDYVKDAPRLEFGNVDALVQTLTEWMDQ